MKTESNSANIDTEKPPTTRPGKMMNKTFARLILGKLCRESKRKKASDAALDSGPLIVPVDHSDSFDHAVAMRWLATAAQKASPQVVSTALALCRLAEKRGNPIRYTIAELTEFGTSKNAVSRHLKAMEDAGVLKHTNCRRRGWHNTVLKFSGNLDSRNTS